MSATTLLGRPVTGDIGHFTSAPKEQRPDEEFLAALDELLAVEGVESVRWEQYTPYFNDGDACEFGVHEPSVKLVGNDEGGDYDDGFLNSFDAWPPVKEGYRDAATGKWVPGVYAPIEIDGVDPAVIEAARTALAAFGSVLEGGAHFILLQSVFGDPSQITATRAGFSVESYEHD